MRQCYFSNRQYVYLATDYETAVKVGMRYGKSVVLNIDSQKMQEDGCKFYQAENNIWLTLAVPPAYINVYK
ncbi:RNA 2'-phosphotransferase [Psychrobacter sp. NZS113]|uniref:RNA 2'-phosphotransferase n=1 Tax=Psychrobacter sp. NZS113 TaxID=2792045 RepID=UPI0034DAC83C